MAPVLDGRLLMRLEAVLAAQGVGTSELTPGLPTAAIRAQLGDAGLTAPAEVLTWWGRHDGWRDGRGHADRTAPIRERVAAGGIFEVIPELQSGSLSSALRGRDFLLSLARDAVQHVPEIENPDEIYHPAWLPVFGTGTMVDYVLDTRATASGGCPVLYYDPSASSGTHADLVAGSLGELISDAVDTIEHGGFEFDTVTGTWEHLADWGTSDPFTRFKRPGRHGGS